MSEATKSPAPASGNVPTWLSAGLIGLALGIGGTMVSHQINAQKEEDAGSSGDIASASAPSGAPEGGRGGGPPAGMMGGMMGGGGGGRGGGGFGGGNKGNLTALVGKLELLTRETLHVELAAEQTAKIGELLAKLDAAEKMTDDEAKTQLDAIEALLTPDQKTALESFRLPQSRPGTAGRPGGGGGPGGGPPGPGGPPSMGMGGGAAPDANPFTQAADQKRLRDLLSRLQPADSKPAQEQPAETKPADAAPPTSEAKPTEPKPADAAPPATETKPTEPK